MARYRIQAPDGRIVTVEGATPPTEADLDQIFAQIEPKKLPVTEQDLAFERNAEIPREFGGTAERKPYFGEVLGQMYTGQSEGLESEAKGALTGGAMALGGELVPTGLAAAGVAAAARPALTGAILGGGERLAHGDISGVPRGAFYGALGMGVMGRLARLHRILRGLGLASEEAAGATTKAATAPGQLSQADMLATVRGASAPAEGFVANPSVATVAEQMVPAGGQGKLIHDLTRAGFSAEQATAIAGNMAKSGAQAAIAPAEAAAVAPVAAETAAPVAAAEAAPVAKLSREEASRQLQELLARKVSEGKAEAAAALEKFMSEMGHGSKVVIPAALLKAQERNRRAHKALQSQGAGVTEP